MLKQPRVKDPQWLRFAENLKCVVCGHPNTVMHHLRKGEQCGTGLKSPDNYCLPLCVDTIGRVGCHTKIHKNERDFAEEHKDIFGDDIGLFCNALYKRYKENEKKFK